MGTVADAPRPPRERPGTNGRTNGRTDQGPLLVVTLENETLAEQVDMALDNAARRSGLRYRRLSVADEAARAIFPDPPLPSRKPDRAQPSHIVVVGLRAGARAVLRHARPSARTRALPAQRSASWRRSGVGGQALLHPDAVPAFVATLRPIACDLTSGIAEAICTMLLDGTPPPVLACVCLADDAGVTVGMALAREAHSRHWPEFTVAVHQALEDRFLRLLAREGTTPEHQRLRPFGGILPEGTLRRHLAESDDRLPRAMHLHYLKTIGGLPGGGGTTDVWDDLTENIRHANRAAADHIAVKLAAVGCRIVSGPGGNFRFTAAEIDLLARVEHRRWSAERLLRGWRPGPRDDARRLHPDPVPFEDLDLDGREKDKASVRAIPEILALSGQSIVRDG